MQRVRKAWPALATAVAVGLVALAGPSSASAAATIGETFAPPGSCLTNATFINAPPDSPDYAAPFGGVITSWSFHADASPPQLRFKVARPLGGPSFTIVGESELQTPAPSEVSSFPVRISVRTGDVIGFFLVTSGNCALNPSPNDSFYRVLGPDMPPGTTAVYTTFANIRLAVAAVLEPDADNDGFGDETQDACPADPALQEAPCDRTAPETTITRQPKDKTEKKKATFEFTSEPGATFECSLNGAAFASCSSPLGVKGKKGKNTFAVRATDVAGNVDPTPATIDWKVRKKKR